MSKCLTCDGKRYVFGLGMRRIDCPECNNVRIGDASQLQKPQPKIIYKHKRGRPRKE